MSIRDWNQGSLMWRFTMAGDTPNFYDTPGIDAPAVWLHAIGAVAGDLRYLRYGRDVRVDRLIWELTINDQYAVTLGWSGPGVGGFDLCHGLSMDTPYAQAAVWVAETAQGELTGYEFIQWPSRGRHILTPRLRQEAPAWVDPHTDTVVAAIGELCEQDAAWAALDRLR
ncbi:hypothetical protein R1X32_07455 (plasmid) [Rhodococcus opacus]|uniref:hypothetical protein n=1 Tax=Rhodococcus opacus TaxID=37919 RepID=UPI0034D226E6